jgi:phosphate transport system substrate-binding protein
VVQGIENDPYGIGYSGIGYVTWRARGPIAPAEGQPAVAASAENAADGSHRSPASSLRLRQQGPGQLLDRLTAEYLRFILSADGQRIVAKAGFDRSTR